MSKVTRQLSKALKANLPATLPSLEGTKSELRISYPPLLPPATFKMFGVDLREVHQGVCSLTINELVTVYEHFVQIYIVKKAERTMSVVAWLHENLHLSKRITNWYFYFPGRMTEDLKAAHCHISLLALIAVRADAYQISWNLFEVKVRSLTFGVNDGKLISRWEPDFPLPCNLNVVHHVEAVRYPRANGNFPSNTWVAILSAINNQTNLGKADTLNTLARYVFHLIDGFHKGFIEKPADTKRPERKRKSYLLSRSARQVLQYYIDHWREIGEGTNKIPFIYKNLVEIPMVPEDLFWRYVPFQKYLNEPEDLWISFEEQMQIRRCLNNLMEIERVEYYTCG